MWWRIGDGSNNWGLWRIYYETWTMKNWVHWVVCFWPFLPLKDHDWSIKTGDAQFDVTWWYVDGILLQLADPNFSLNDTKVAVVGIPICVHKLEFWKASGTKQEDKLLDVDWSIWGLKYFIFFKRVTSLIILRLICRLPSFNFVIFFMARLCKKSWVSIPRHVIRQDHA